MLKEWRLIAAVILGLVALFSAYMFISQQQKEAMVYKQRSAKLENEVSQLKNALQRIGSQASARPTGSQDMPVVVAKTKIPQGDIITSDKIELRFVPPNARANNAAATIEGVLGLIAKTDILIGEQIILDKLMDASQRFMLVPPGNRLYTMSVEQTGLFSFIKPGDSIDIGLTFPIDANQLVTSALFTNVKIVAINGRITYNLRPPAQEPSGRKPVKREAEEKPQAIQIDPNKGTITVALPPKDAGVLYMAEKLGKIVIFPRSSIDTSIDRIPPVTAEAVLQQAVPEMYEKMRLLAEQQKAEAEKASQKKEESPQLPPPNPPKRIKVRRGADVEYIEISEDGEAMEKGLTHLEAKEPAQDASSNENETVQGQVRFDDEEGAEAPAGGSAFLFGKG